MVRYREMFEIERFKKYAYDIHNVQQGTEALVRDREKFDIEDVRDRESQLYLLFHSIDFCVSKNLCFLIMVIVLG